MAQVEKLRKLKHNVLKKMNSFGKQGSGRVSSTASYTSSGAHSPPPQCDHHHPHQGAAVGTGGGEKMMRVWVGKSRRKYHVSSQVVDHPAFQHLIVNRSDGCGDGGITVGCEVVLFEHLLWMLENAADNSSGDSLLLDELVAFYT